MLTSRYKFEAISSPLRHLVFVTKLLMIFTKVSCQAVDGRQHRFRFLSTVLKPTKGHEQSQTILKLRGHVEFWQMKRVTKSVASSSAHILLVSSQMHL